MVQLDEKGFLDTDFMQENFMSGQITEGLRGQVQFNITELTATQKAQATLQISEQQNVKAQVSINIIDSVEQVKAQALAVIQNFLNQQKAQVSTNVGGIKISNNQITTTNVVHAICGGFLTGGFLEDTFLTTQMCAAIKSQVEMFILGATNVKCQVNRTITDGENALKGQATLTIDTQADIRSQVDTVTVTRVNAQVTISIYNTNKLRVLCDFPSRGTTGLNWTSTSTQPGDFSPNNLNNDLEEFYWRSVSSAVTNVRLVCDTEVPQGVFVDTLAIRGHNLTTSATVLLEGSNSASFATTPFSETLNVTEDHIYYVAPDLPTAGYRYWRFTFNDNTNTDGFIQVGLIVFGNALILNSQCPTFDISETNREFKNSMRSEGFTTVANSRAVKKSLRLDFRDIEFNSDDYNLLTGIFDFARTTLKCLWMVDPSTVSLQQRFTTFSKLKQIPSKRHRVKAKEEKMDHVTFTVELDEAE